ncbi:MAG: NAD(P)H-dependent oxidoreductase [Thermodesulfobacteriota bacterium]|jgi:multimeric flavodoxin WrbA/putative sterol carrier protein
MFEKPTIVAVNGSPHAGVGNTSLMIEMLRPTLAEEGFDLEVINLAGQNIEYCTGCAFCMEKGRCWIDDDHRKILEKLLAADGVILASPVYFMHVTGQMKTFLDRSLAFGHKPRPTWKPGLAISVSAGMGETDTANYLAFLLRTFGAFSVGTLTAMATQPGGFLGKEAVEARAADLARDLARAIKEKRRYPATDRDLRFYQFMGNLVKSQKETVMKHDYKYWQEHGFYDSFEKYVGQETTEVPFDRELREAWIKEMIEEQKSKKKAQSGELRRGPSATGQPAKSCRELLQSMPLGFNPETAGDLRAVFQFEIHGDENFISYLEITDGRCTYHEGPADKPNLVIKTPAEVWLKISRGELSGQKAFMEGRYKVEGDMNLLLKLSSLFSA